MNIRKIIIEKKTRDEFHELIGFYYIYNVNVFMHLIYNLFFTTYDEIEGNNYSFISNSI